MDRHSQLHTWAEGLHRNHCGLPQVDKTAVDCWTAQASERGCGCEGVRGCGCEGMRGCVITFLLETLQNGQILLDFVVWGKGC